MLLVSVVVKVTNELLLPLSEVIPNVGTLVCIGPVAGTIYRNSILAVGGTYQGPVASTCSKKRRGAPLAIQLKLAKRFAGERKVLLVDKAEQRVRAASSVDPSTRNAPLSTAKLEEIERKENHRNQIEKLKLIEYDKVVKTLEGISNRNLPKPSRYFMLLTCFLYFALDVIEIPRLNTLVPSTPSND